MTDDIHVSYSFQISGHAWSNGSAPMTATDTRTFAYADCEQDILNDSTVKIISRRNRNKMVVTRDVANALTHCCNFETLSAHTTRLCATIPLLRDQEKDVLQVLESARDAGILVAGKDTAERLNSMPNATPPPPTRVFIITCDRPVAIARLLDSMRTGCDLTRHDQLVLIDDSRHESNAQKNRQLVAQFNLSSPQPMLYFGAEAAASLLSQLLEGLPAQERGLRFLLDRVRWADQPTYGLSRTLSLLLSVGYRALVLDDDIVCRAVRSPVSHPAVTFSHAESREAWFYPAEADLLQDSVACDGDPLAQYADALGRPLATVLATLNGGPLDPACLDHCNGNMLGALDGEAPVLVTQCGSAGDPGTVGPRWVVHLDEASIARLLSSNPDQQVLPHSQICWLGHTRTTVSLRGVMSQLTGLDNSQLLPPYAPVLRSEDDLFASMTAYLHPNSAVLTYAWAVPHLPIENRSPVQALQPFIAGVGLSTLASHVRGKIDIHNRASAEFRLAALASDIRALGECPAATLHAGCEMERAKYCAVVVETLEARLAAARDMHHPGWERFLQDYLAQAQAALVAPGQFGSASLAQWTHAVQDAAAAFADALDAWQVIRTRSASIVARMLASHELVP